MFLHSKNKVGLFETLGQYSDKNSLYEIYLLVQNVLKLSCEPRGFDVKHITWK